MSHTISSAIIAILLTHTWLHAQTTQAVVGDIRVQAISPSLLRLELKGPKGFEDRPTFHVVNRADSERTLQRVDGEGETLFACGGVGVRIPSNAHTLAEVVITELSGRRLFTLDPLPPNNPELPPPNSHPQAWAFSDTPRIARSDAPDAPRTGNVGWDPSNDSADVYLFCPDGDYRTLRNDFLKLTGPTDMMPLWAFGAWDSRWYEYTEQSALQQVDDYRSRDIPLDALVIDTDWRQGGSHGYDVNTKDFPNLKRFFDAAHAKHVHVMFNDHPEPVAESALDPAELKYRTENLTRLLNEGLDVWWYDRNWHTHLHSPMNGLLREAWGIELYRNITAAAHPQRRPLIMANVVGIDNGIHHAAPDVATHRSPLQWTGDIKPTFDTLAGSVANAVHAGVANCFPYQSDDLGGHVSDPTPEAFVRWIEFGALSPIYRPHCTKDLKRMPWAFGPEAEKIARDYVKLRYRLLPTLYAAAHENYVTGEPILRRLDLITGGSDAEREDQYLLGDDLLVAPITTGQTPRVVPTDLLRTPDGQAGLAVEYFDNDELRGQPKVRGVDAKLDFEWKKGSPNPALPNDHFSARWTGKIGPMPGKPGERYTLSATSDDGVRLWLDGKLVIDQWKGQDAANTAASMPLEAGKRYDIRIEYNDLMYDASFHLNLMPADATPTPQRRGVWLPSGDWINLWTGQTASAGNAVELSAALRETPMFVQSNAMILLGPDVQWTDEKPWDTITIDYYPGSTRVSHATLYEDDGESVAYQTGAFRTTRLTAGAIEQPNTLSIRIDPAQGSFPSAVQSRAWNLRVHHLSGMVFREATLDGKKLDVKQWPQQRDAMPLSHGSTPDAAVSEFVLPSAPVRQARDVTLRFDVRK